MTAVSSSKDSSAVQEQMDAHLRKERRPRLIGWFIGLLSAGILALVFLVGNLVCSGISMAQSQQSLQPLLSPPWRPEELLAHPHVKDLPPELSHNARRIISIYSLLEQGDANRALRRTKESSLPEIQSKKELLQTTNSLAELSNELKRTNQALSLLGKRITPLEKSYRKYQFDFARAIDLPRWTSTSDEVLNEEHNEEEKEPLPIYTKGIFKDLPVLENIPDDLSGFPALRKHLENNDIEWNISGDAKAKKKIERRLKDIKEQVLLMVFQQEQLLSELSVLLKKKEKLLQKDSQLKEQMLQVTYKFLIRIIWPNPKPIVAFTYDIFRTKAMSSGYKNLPPLQIRG